jgi:hypothetical protein
MDAYRVFAFALLVAALAGCGVRATVPALPSSYGPLARPHGVFWGIGLSGFISAEVPRLDRAEV